MLSLSEHFSNSLHLQRRSYFISLALQEFLFRNKEMSFKHEGSECKPCLKEHNEQAPWSRKWTFCVINNIKIFLPAIPNVLANVTVSLLSQGTVQAYKD